MGENKRLWLEEGCPVRSLFFFCGKGGNKLKGNETVYQVVESNAD